MIPGTRNGDFQKPHPFAPAPGDAPLPPEPAQPTQPAHPERNLEDLWKAVVDSARGE